MSRRQHRTLLPAQPRALHHQQLSHNHNGHIHPAHTSFYDLPAELRIEIYRLALSTVKIHILPPNSATPCAPHPLVLTTRQVRNEVLPLIHNSCPIHANITDFNFDGLLAWMSRMPPDQEANLCKNGGLRVELCTTTNNPAHDKGQGGTKVGTCNSMKNSPSLRKWLHLRADKYRPQPDWKYVGPKPDYKTMNEMRRRAKRARHPGEKRELVVMLKAIGVEVPGEDV